jgi:hypothetical protein
MRPRITGKIDISVILYYQPPRMRPSLTGKNGPFSKYISRPFVCTDYFTAGFKRLSRVKSHRDIVMYSELVHSTFYEE